MILLIGGQKGGPGKTTVAMNIAVMCVMKKKDILFIDADPSQNASNWCEVRDNKLGGESRVPYLQKYGDKIHLDLKHIEKKYDDIIVDTAGFDSKELHSGLKVADLIVVPLRPSQLDIWTVSKCNNLVDDVKDRNPNLKMLIVLSQVSTHSRASDASKTREFIENSRFEHISVANTSLGNRIIFQESVPEGRGVIEMGAPENKGVIEIQKLYGEIFNEKTL